MSSKVLPQLPVPVVFDITNKEHVRAAYNLIFSPVATIKGSPRFVLEKPYVDIRMMMLHKLAEQQVRTVLS